MATYKVLQDIEAEDKFIGPLTLKQFIFGMVAAASAYLSVFTLTRGIWFVTVVFAPIIAITGFLAWPWGRDQPTEVWLLAKLRFMIKPRRRIWDQDGIQELVTITAPRREARQFTNNLSVGEVKSRLRALADTIDSRGWAVKNVDINLYAQPSILASQDTDRLIDPSSLPSNVPVSDVTASEDIMDEQNNPVAQQLDSMIKTTAQEYRKKLVDSMHNEPAEPAATYKKPEAKADYWFLNEPSPSEAKSKGPAIESHYSQFGDQIVAPGTPSPTANAAPTPDEIHKLEQIKAEKGRDPISYSHMRTILPISEQQALAKHKKQAVKKPAAPVTPLPNPVILGLANRDDLNVDTVGREADREINKARKKELSDGDEVVIPLH